MYYLVFGFFRLLSLLPMPVLYAIGDGLRWIVFKGIGYRRQVVLGNLRQAFPDQPEAFIQQTAADFFRNFTDTWMETIRFMGIGKGELEKMISADLSVFKTYAEQEKSCILLSGHFMNWEIYNMVLPARQPLRFIGVYMHLSSPVMERLFRYIRGRFGSVLIPAQVVRQGIESYLTTPFMLALGADQSPSRPADAYWLNYLNQPSAFPKGPAIQAIRRNLPVVFAWIEKKGRGRYEVQVREMYADTTGLTPETITLDYAKRMQEAICRQPANYLWSHRRWKHPYQAAYRELWIDPQAPPER